MAAKQTIEDIPVDGRTVLVRVDYNVPFRPGTTDISDDSRIAASLPTLLYLLERECRLIVCSHPGPARAGAWWRSCAWRPYRRGWQSCWAHPYANWTTALTPT